MISEINEMVNEGLDNLRQSLEIANENKILFNFKFQDFQEIKISFLKSILKEFDEYCSEFCEDSISNEDLNVIRDYYKKEIEEHLNSFQKLANDHSSSVKS